MSTPDSPLLITSAVAPMFGEPDPASEQVSQALLGFPVEPLEASGAWTLIRTPDGYTGWSPADALVPVPPGWGEPFREIEDLWANLRSAADSKRAALVHAPIGTRLPQCGQEEGWVQLLLPDGRRLWTEEHRTWTVGKRFFRSANRLAIPRTARRFLGIPYLWGGCSPWGLDCSGFVQLVYRLHGLPLLRDAHMQFEQGAKAPEPRAADLVFFGPEDKPGRITHVGMMLDRRRYIHAKGSACVRIDVLDPASPTFRGARRFL